MHGRHDLFQIRICAHTIFKYKHLSQFKTKNMRNKIIVSNNEKIPKLPFTFLRNILT